ncbi:MAG: GNAT family N-acetyltransferase [Clostridia bacterium]|nr:GNAT family N-acetyltransferase [Clostridia bacterium]
MEIREYESFDRQEILCIYESAGWVNYTRNPDMLKRAYLNSLCVVGAYEKGELIGIIRTVGDGASIVFIQDIIVRPDFQRKGVGRALIEYVLDKYSDVYQIQLLTDDQTKTDAFYRSVGFVCAADINCRAYILARSK